MSSTSKRTPAEIKSILKYYQVLSNVYLKMYSKGGGYGKIYTDFIRWIFCLDGVETHDTIFIIFGVC